MIDLEFILASGSPRRLSLLKERGLSPRVVVPDVDEKPLPGESPTEMVRRLARLKGRQVADSPERNGSPALILAADTVVFLEGQALGKPLDEADAARMLRKLSGRSHEVSTGLFLIRTDDGRSVSRAETTRVRFRSLSEEQILIYVAGGEPMDKAGAYGIQGAGASLVEAFDGSFSNVVGLPVEALDGWLAEIGLTLSRWID